MDFFAIIIGLFFLIKGGEYLFDGSLAISINLKIPKFIIGMTVVSFATSAPELVVSVKSALMGYPDLALGNIVGSNICNILLILGFSSLIRPLRVHRQIIRKDLPILLIVSFAFILMLINQEVAIWEGVVLCAGIVIYILSSFKGANNNSESVGEDLSLADVSVEDRRHSKTFPLVLLLLSGLILLVLGASFFEKGGIGLAKSFGVSEAVIGLTLLAFGTSLPELATSLVACIKNEGDIIAGNAIGSSIFNILAILGITAMFKPLLVNDINLIDYSIMIGVVILCWLFVFKKMNLNRIKGGLFLCLYAGYIINILYR